MEVKPACKLTEVGVLPEDWNFTPLGRLIRSVEYGSSAKSKKKGQIPVLRMGNIQGGKIDWEDLVYTDDAWEIGKYALRAGDVLFNRTNTFDLVGKTAIYLGEQPAVFAGYLIRINVVPELLDSRFLNYVLNAEFARKYSAKILSLAVGQANINGQKLKTYPIPLPPTKAEQEGIAEALSDADAFIESLEQLIAKKRRVKQGAMQELLTGSKRLPGFSGEWETKRLGKLGVFLKGRGITKAQAVSGDLPCIRYGELYTRHEDHIREFYSWISRDVAVTATRLHRGDILFAGSGETKEAIGKCAAFVHDSEAYAGGDVVILRPHDSDSRFLGYFLNTAAIATQKASRGQGDAVVHISAASLAAISGKFPERKEQAAIAAVIADMDADLATLGAKLAKAWQVKQGMMQDLLTGRIRLTQPEKPIVPATGHNWAFNEAVVISVLAKSFGSEQYPLGRKRYTKLAYLMHRHHEHRAEGYLKKAAGPYNPATRYKGTEGIAVKNGYIRQHQRDQFSGFVAGDKIAEAEVYFGKWYGADVLTWLEQFRRSKNDELELLATVDMAMEDLRRAGKPVDLAGVKVIIREHPEWEAKLDRDIFSDPNITRAIKKCGDLFKPGT